MSKKKQKQEETVETVEKESEEVKEQEPQEENSLEKEIEQLKEELAKAKNDVARAYADTENMKKRLQNEADMTKKYRFQQAGLEKGKYKPSIVLAYKLAKLFGTDIETLFCLKEFGENEEE